MMQVQKHTLVWPRPNLQFGQWSAWICRCNPCRILRSGQSTLMHEAKQRPTDIETMCDKISQTTNMTSPLSTNLYSLPSPPRLLLLPLSIRCCWFFIFYLNFPREDKLSAHVRSLHCPDSHLHNFRPGGRPAQLHASMQNTSFFLHMNLQLIEEGALLINLSFQEWETLR